MLLLPMLPMLLLLPVPLMFGKVETFSVDKLLSGRTTILLAATTAATATASVAPATTLSMVAVVDPVASLFAEIATTAIADAALIEQGVRLLPKLVLMVLLPPPLLVVRTFALAAIVVRARMPSSFVRPCVRVCSCVWQPPA